MYAHLHDPPPSATAQRPELPRGVDRVIGRAMAKRTDDRYVTAGEVAAALRGAVAGERLPELRPPRPRTRARLAVVGAVVALGLVLAIVALVSIGNDPGSSEPAPTGAASALPASSLAKIDAETGEVALVIRDAPGLGASPRPHRRTRRSR